MVRVHQNVVDYLKIQYPLIPFRTDFAAGIKMTPGQAVKHKRLQYDRAWPDLFIATASYKNKSADYYGLFIELKKPGTKLKRERDATRKTAGDPKLRRAGDWYDLHIEEQAEMLATLRIHGYKAEFAVGFDEAKAIIDEYLKAEELKTNEEVL